MGFFSGHITPARPTLAALWEDRVRDTPEAPFLHSFSRTLTFAQVDAWAGRLAREFAAAGVAAGDRVALYTQNDPAFVAAVLAAWKLGCAAVPINPMNTARELRYQLRDSGAAALVTLPTLWDDVAAGVVGETPVRVAVLAGFERWVQGPDGALAHEAVPTDAGAAAPAPPGVTLLADNGALDVPAKPATASPASSGDAAAVTPDTPALITYTSGTTGNPKGAVNTQGNVAFNAEVYERIMGIAPGDPILAIAPLFHITGSVGHLAFAIRVGSPLVLSHRFHPQVVLDSVRRWRPRATVGAITALMALADHPDVKPGDLASLDVVYSGGAPIPPALADRLEAAYGAYIHNIYGMSETASPLVAVPPDGRAPVDPASGALSVGVPVFDTSVLLMGDDGAEVAAGQEGELWAAGPQITPGYWERPDANAESFTMVNGRDYLHTGDVAVRDADGWLYLVDRKKDMINAAGYKVWPREVEGVLYDHPAVSEAAVVGVPDEYRGETVKAFVSLKAGARASAEELMAFCKENMAAYKYPRILEIVDEIPKTATGKVLRRLLRD